MTKTYPLSQYKAILFDFDGVLGKTMEDNYTAWAHSFLPYGVKIKREEYFLLEGAPPKKVAEIFLKKNHLGIESIGDIVRSKENYYIENRSFSLYDGAQELIENLKANGLQLALVTGASYKRLMGTDITSFLNQFDVLITGDQVSQGKPNPEPYLLGAQKLIVTTSECLVIENAPMGIKSAKEAGMYCVAICSTLGKEHLAQADAILDTIGELSSFLGQ
ncbi:HAD family phosphatase [Nitrospinae bacterium]|nr:HAD family phosphatase [Nitrospinota bacterium]